MLAFIDLLLALLELRISLVGGGEFSSLLFYLYFKNILDLEGRISNKYYICSFHFSVAYQLEIIT